MLAACRFAPLLLLFLAGNASAAIITFNDVGGDTGDPFATPYSEDEFTLTPTTGRWLIGQVGGKVAGNPQPAIYGDTFTASLELTRDDAGLFSFASIDIASWHFDGGSPNSVEYTIVGLRDGATVFTTTGTVSSSPLEFPGGDFWTIASPAQDNIDVLRIAMVRQDSQAYVLDNINLGPPDIAPVPEPASILLWAGIAGCGLVLARRRRGRSLATVRSARRR
jgi:hypothetical protein